MIFLLFLKTQEVESFKIAAQTELKSLLQSHFPQVKVADSSDFKSWAKNFFAKIEEEAQARESSSGNKSDTETLEKQANHYKAILSETVSLFFEFHSWPGANIINYGHFHVNYGTQWSREEKITNYRIIHR